ncbi:MAG: hypothetical protein KF699_05915 [Phycisphaeraceae bacterium]|nr:hypothetical protein [Phycisphaeraceae bacterium]
MRARRAHALPPRLPAPTNIAAAAPVITSTPSPAPAPLAPANDDADALHARLAIIIGHAAFDRYFRDRVRIRFNDGRVEVHAPSRAAADVLRRRFAVALRQAAGAQAEFIGDDLPASTAHAAHAPAHRPESPAPPARPRPAPVARYRLEDFVVGESNRVAYDTASRLAESADDDAPRHLFIHGPCGLGKSHLLHGAAVRFRERHPGAVVRVTSGEAFMNDFVAAIRDTGPAGPGKPAAGIARFRRAYRRCDLLCIDDVHFLAAKQATQDELLHTFDDIERGGAKVILVSDQHPRALRKFSPALVSRFMAGLVAGVAPPESGLRERIIRVFAQRRGLRLDDGAVRAVASRTGWLPAASAGPSVRDIEGVLTKLDALRRVAPEFVAADGRIGAGAVERALGGGPAADGSAPAAQRPARPVRMHTIVSQTCAALAVDTADLAGPTRHKRVVLARAIITYIARSLTTQSFPDIARAIGRPAHSTVITAYQRFSRQLQADEPVALEHSAEPTTISVLVRQLTEAVVRESARG